jgi:hypothetical protein
MNLAFHKKSKETGSLSQLNFNTFKFPKLGIYTRSIHVMCVLNKNRMMDNVQKHNNCINIPLSPTSRSYLNYGKTWESLVAHGHEWQSETETQIKAKKIRKTLIHTIIEEIKCEPNYKKVVSWLFMDSYQMINGFIVLALILKWIRSRCLIHENKRRRRRKQ